MSSRLDFQFHLLGVSFRTAPAAVREALNFGDSEARRFLHAAAEALPGIEACVLSTCNRTEFYIVLPTQSKDKPGQKISTAVRSEDAPLNAGLTGSLDPFLAVLMQFRPGAPILRDDCHRYTLSGSDAVRHLCRVAGGIDSAILGDAQILDQVKSAMAVAGLAGTMGAVLNQAFTVAIQAAKRARRETCIGFGAASLGSAIKLLLVDYEQPLLEKRLVPRVLIIGAGEIARDIGRHVTKHGIREGIFLNRTVTKAQQLAEHCGGRFEPWESLPAALAWADVVIAATASPRPILTRELVTASAVCSALGRGARRHSSAVSCSSQLVIDAGMPRNVAPDCGLRTIDIDDIQKRQQSALLRRRSAIPQVENIITDAVARWENWQAAQPIEELIKALYQKAARISRNTALEVVGENLSLLDRVEQTLHRNLKRCLRGPVRQLRYLARSSHPESIDCRRAFCQPFSI